MNFKSGLFILVLLMTLQLQSYAGIPIREEQTVPPQVEKKSTTKKKKTLKKTLLQKITTKADVDEDKTAAIVFAILLPPVGVAIYQDGITTDFWTTLVLWILGIVPGIIYALTIVLKRY